MNPEALLIVLDTLLKTKAQLETTHIEIKTAIDILVAEMKAANILTTPNPE